MPRGKNKCRACGRWAGPVHRCITPSGPPRGATPPAASPAHTKPTAPSPSAPARTGTALLQEIKFDYELKEVRAQRQQVRDFRELEQAVREFASAPDGLEHVLAAARKNVARGDFELAAIIEVAARRAQGIPARIPQPLPDSEIPNQDVGVDTYAMRCSYAEAGHQELVRIEDELRSAHLEHGELMDAAECATCRHPGHPAGCPMCECAAYVLPTQAQTAGYARYRQYVDALDEWRRRKAFARDIRVGDRFRVVGGNSAPFNTRGAALRVVEGKYGEMRALLRTEGGHEVWVTVTHLSRELG